MITEIPDGVQERVTTDGIGVMEIIQKGTTVILITI